MKPIIIKLPFIYQDFLEAQKLIWDFSNRNFISTQIKFMLAGFLCMAAGMFSHDWISLGLGCSFVFYIILGCIGFYERKKRFLKRIKRYTAFEGEYYVFNFGNDAFEYEDWEKQLRLKWSVFESFLEYKDNILISLKDDALVSFTLSRKELGEEIYQDLLLFLQEKLSNQNG